MALIVESQRVKLKGLVECCCWPLNPE